MKISAKIALFLFASLATLAINKAKPTEDFGMPESCSTLNLGYCTEKHKHYPTDIVEKVLKAAHLSFRKKSYPTLAERSDEGMEERDCKVETSDALIHEIIDEAGDVRVVLQSESGFRQQITIERCLEPGRINDPTYHFKEYVVKNNNLNCTEETLDISFMVLSKDWKSGNGRVEMAKPMTAIPVRCNCVLKEANDLN